jgi:hypothetical protein
VSPYFEGCTENPLVYKSSLLPSTPAAVAQYTSNCEAAVKLPIATLSEDPAVPGTADDAETGEPPPLFCPAFTSVAVGAVSPSVTATHLTFSDTVGVTDIVMEVPAESVALAGCTEKPEEKQSRSADTTSFDVAQ